MDGLKRKSKSLAEYVHWLVFVRQQDFQYATGWKSRKTCALYKSEKVGVWKLLLLSAEALVSRRNAFRPFFSLAVFSWGGVIPTSPFPYVSQGEIKAPVSPLSGLLRCSQCSSTESQKTGRLHSIDPTPSASLLQTWRVSATLPHLSPSHGWRAWLGPWKTSLHYGDVHKAGRPTC